MSKIQDSLIGLAIGDAMGVPIEFSIRDKCLKNPLTEMVGFGSHNVPAGSWSDDTSMTIATMDSIIKKQKIDYTDIMNKFCEWVVDYKYTPCNFRFDIGHTCFKAIYNFTNNNMEPLKCGLTDIKSNGNGSLMRILPVALYCNSKNLMDKEILDLTNNISSLTHAHEISKMGCYIYVRYLMFLLNGKDKFSAYSMIKCIDYSSYSEETIKVYDRILKNDIKKYKIDEINSGGYVVDTLEASLWCTIKNDSYESAVITAVNLGEDTDTIGAITGSLNGIIYGSKGIPEKWLNKLKKRDYLEELTNQFINVIKYKELSKYLQGIKKR